VSSPSAEGVDGDDASNGRSYSEIAATSPLWELRVHPYALWERAQLGIHRGPYLVEPLSVPLTPLQRATLRAFHEKQELDAKWIRYTIVSGSLRYLREQVDRMVARRADVDLAGKAKAAPPAFATLAPPAVATFASSTVVAVAPHTADSEAPRALDAVTVAEEKNPKEQQEKEVPGAVPSGY